MKIAFKCNRFYGYANVDQNRLLRRFGKIGIRESTCHEITFCCCI
jgi:hypothetical protein